MTFPPPDCSIFTWKKPTLNPLTVESGSSVIWTSVENTLENDAENVSWSDFCTEGVAKITVQNIIADWIVVEGNKITFTPQKAGDYLYTILQ